MRDGTLLGTGTALVVGAIRATASRDARTSESGSEPPTAVPAANANAVVTTATVATTFFMVRTPPATEWHIMMSIRDPTRKPFRTLARSNRLLYK
jgi:hypothetical protein